MLCLKIRYIAMVLWSAFVRMTFDKEALQLTLQGVSMAVTKRQLY